MIYIFFVLKENNQKFDVSVTYKRTIKQCRKLAEIAFKEQMIGESYDKLTENYEVEIRRLLEYLGLSWEDACLAPQSNKRSVRTASQQQVRQKIYTGSSQAWRKYEPFLAGVFNKIKT